VRGLGLLVGSEFTAADGTPDSARAAKAQQLAATKGLLLLTCGAHMNTVRMIPPLVVTAEQVDEALDIWGKVLAEV
jgi:4-aminobutyrate aminotransferase